MRRDITEENYKMEKLQYRQLRRDIFLIMQITTQTLQNYCKSMVNKFNYDFFYS